MDPATQEDKKVIDIMLYNSRVEIMCG